MNLLGQVDFRDFQHRPEEFAPYGIEFLSVFQITALEARLEHCAMLVVFLPRNWWKRKILDKRPVGTILEFPTRLTCSPDALLPIGKNLRVLRSRRVAQDLL